MKTAVTTLLDDIVMILELRKWTIAKLADDLGRDYHQTYDWIVRRQFNPQAEALMSLMAWRDKHISARRKRAARVQTTGAEKE